MYGPLKFALVLAIISLALLIVSPLAIFIYQLMENPRGIIINVEDIAILGDNKVSVKVVLHYSLDVPLSRIVVVIGKEHIIFENVVKGTTSKVVILTPDDIQQGIRELRLEVARLFKFLLRFK